MQLSAGIVTAEYTYTKYDEMILTYDECRRNVRATAKAHSKRYPGDRHPTYETITDALHRLRKTGADASRSRTSIRYMV